MSTIPAVFWLIFARKIGMKSSIWPLFFFLLSAHGYSHGNFEVVLKQNAILAEKYLLQNISRVDTPKGFVVASPTKTDPNYYYHWVRDAALTMQSLSITKTSNYYQPLVLNYIMLESEHQKINKLSDQGEPKFNPDGTAFSGPWGRPQNDGPALRALTLIKQANFLILQNRQSDALKLYAPVLPAKSPIKIDLEYVSNHWKTSDFDLWEEVKGNHFYTRSVQAYALAQGADLARKLKDLEAAKWYEQQSKQIHAALGLHWSVEKSIYQATLNSSAFRRKNNKESGLDSSVILAVLHTHNLSSSYGFLDEKIMATFNQLEKKFKNLYPINQEVMTPPDGWPILGAAIGRYPEDIYFGGHPWYLLTSGFAEFCYRYALLSNVTSVKNRWKLKGDQFLARVIFHLDAQGHQSEQFNKITGAQLSAQDLTWSYAAYLTAYYWRNKLLTHPTANTRFQNSRL